MANYFMAIVTMVRRRSQSFMKIIKLFMWEQLGYYRNSLPLSLQ